MMQSKKRLTKRNFLIGSSLLVILAVAGIITGVTVVHTPKTTSQDTVQNPDYATILPKGKTITQLGGWARLQPPGAETATYAYNDIIGNVAISVIEQPLPESFKADPDAAVAKLAKGYDATETVKVGNTTVYIGSSAKGPQSVIFTKNNLLILIKSEKPIKNTAWSTYAASLQ